MEFNVEKCKVLRVVRTRTIYDRQYTLGSSHLSVVQSEKDLGVWISDTLNWNIHTDNIVAKAQKMLGLLYRTLKDIDDNSVKRLLYFTWVRPTLEYASPVWSPYKKRNINKIEKVQRRASRLILGHEVDYKSRLEKLHLLPLYMRREITDLVFLFKIIHELVMKLSTES
ncbi:RNA-directed DNA polymerase from mobile element jockey [Paramuricea clavata]|uniref:RNA-directed DNA polymerase from mobile element jockey n=1 Tax=Paramuricea clavata TaxID=317549 RepID=A0A7D9IRN1_PARCT|nr:RNA-directed DNA polymerase from mobile element jockey [Paramuricea clavata]